MDQFLNLSSKEGLLCSIEFLLYNDWQERTLRLIRNLCGLELLFSRHSEKLCLKETVVLAKKGGWGEEQEIVKGFREPLARNVSCLLIAIVQKKNAMSKMLYFSSEPLNYNEKTAKGCSGFISAPFPKLLVLAGTNNSNLFYPSVST